MATGCAAGLPTEVSIHGHQRPLPAPVEVAAYRIVQESRAGFRVLLESAADIEVVAKPPTAPRRWNSPRRHAPT